jgi:hypothetical protein
MTVAFKELAGSPIEKFSSIGMQAQRVLVCAWNDRRALVEELLGEGYEYGATNPACYPGVALVVVTNVRVEPFGEDMLKQTLTSLTEGLNAYTGFAKVMIDYKLMGS